MYMKAAYETKVWKYNNFVILTWEDYAFCQYRLHAATEEEALNERAAMGWIAKERPMKFKY